MKLVRFQDDQIFPVRTQPKPALRIGAGGEKSALVFALGKFEAFQLPIAPTVQAIVKSSNPRIALRVLADRRDGDTLQSITAWSLKLLFAQAHQSAAVHARPKIS